MLCEWDLAQMLAGSLGLKFFNVQLMHKIHSLSLPRLASLELSRWEYFYMTVLSWVSRLPGLSPHSSLCSRGCTRPPPPHHPNKLSSVCRITEPGCQQPWGTELALPLSWGPKEIRWGKATTLYLQYPRAKLGSSLDIFKERRACHLFPQSLLDPLWLSF